VASTFELAVKNVGQLDNVRADNKIKKEFYELKSAYEKLSNAYASLPRGSLMSAKKVACGQRIVAKLTKQLVNFSSDIVESPLYPNAARQEFSEFKELVAKGALQKDTARKKFDAFYSGVIEYERRHLDAIDKTIIAVEQGRRLNQLLENYSSINVSGVLSIIQSGFSFASTLNGVDVSKSATVLKKIKNDMEMSEYWKLIDSIPLTSIAQCNIEPVTKEN
jgi:hypothetical protein